MTKRYPPTPDAVRTASTDDLRAAFLVQELFVEGEVRTHATHSDRLIVAGVVPGPGELDLSALDHYGPDLLARREVGVVNIGAPGEVVVDGTTYRLEHRDGLYAGRGSSLAFRGEGARFYVVTAPSHGDAPTVHLPFADTDPVHLGDDDGAGRRSLHKFVWGPDGPASSQLQFGVTVLAPGSVWNTYPPHLHERRTEIYLYFELEDPARVIHLMGEPEHTRHLVVRDEEAVISPPWSIHSGVGTGRYSFVWAMAGENREYTDLAGVDVDTLR